MADETEISLALGIQQQNPRHADMEGRWRRYRYFARTDLFGADYGSEKVDWLVQGDRELDASFAVRVDLSREVFLSPFVVQRMAGGLTARRPARTYPDDSKLPGQTRDRIQAWRDNADGHGRSIDDLIRIVQPEALAMGGVGIEVVSDAGPNDPPEAPRCVLWKAEDILDGGVDDALVPTFVKLRLQTRDVSSYDETVNETVTRYRILTREWGYEYRIDSSGPGSRMVAIEHQWRHGLGIVPFVLWPGHETNWPFLGGSYIDGVSEADHGAMLLDSDQRNTSHLHGSPTLKLHMRGGGKDGKNVKDVAVGATTFIHLDPGSDDMNREDASYLEADMGGAAQREVIIERCLRMGLQTAFIDPTAVLGAGGVTAMSGSAMAHAFTQAERPILEKFTGTMEAAERRLTEVVARFATPRDEVPLPEYSSSKPFFRDLDAANRKAVTAAAAEWAVEFGGLDGDEIAEEIRLVVNRFYRESRARACHRFFDGVVTRSRDWQMLAGAQYVADVRTGYDLVPSTTARKEMAYAVTRSLLPNAPIDVLQEIREEFDAAEREGAFDPPGARDDDELSAIGPDGELIRDQQRSGPGLPDEDDLDPDSAEPALPDVADASRGARVGGRS